MPTATLHDGRQVDSASAEWRLECLARYALGRGSREQILAWLQRFGEEHPKMVQDLRDRMNAIKRARIVSGAKRHPERQNAAPEPAEVTGSVTFQGASCG